MVRYLSSSHLELSERGKLDPRTGHGIFVGYKVLPGGVWTGVCKVMYVQAFRDWTAYEVTAALETTEINMNENFLRFPFKDGTVIGQLREDEEW